MIGIPLVFLLFLVFIVLKWLAMCGSSIRSVRGWAARSGADVAARRHAARIALRALRFVPFCIGWSIWFAEILAFGCLILTRVGTRRAERSRHRDRRPQHLRRHP